MPPSVSRRSARSRAAGTGERSSSSRASRASAVASEMLTVTSWRWRERLEKIEIAGDERRLGDDADREPVIGAQHLQDPAGKPELPLGRLVGIGGGADHQRVAGELGGIERPREHLGDVGFDQDLFLEGLFGR